MQRSYNPLVLCGLDWDSSFLWSSCQLRINRVTMSWVSMSQSRGYDSWWPIGGISLQTKIQLMLMISPTCTKWDEFAWGHASVSVGGRCWVPILHTFPTLFSLFCLMTITNGTIFSSFSYLSILTCVVMFHLIFITLPFHQLLWYIMPFLWLIEDECLENIYGLCVVFIDVICSTKDPEHEAYRRI